MPDRETKVNHNFSEDAREADRLPVPSVTPRPGCRESKFLTNPVFVTLFDGATQQCLINIGPKAHSLGVDQIVDHERHFVFKQRYHYKKKACFHRLFCWSECTDLNRGPLVPQKRLGSSVQGGGGLANAYGIRVSEFSILFELGPFWGSFGGSVDHS